MKRNSKYWYRGWHRDPQWRPPSKQAGEFFLRRDACGTVWNWVGSSPPPLGRWSLVTPCRVCARYMHDTLTEAEIGREHFPRISRLDSPRRRSVLPDLVCSECRPAPFCPVAPCEGCGMLFGKRLQYHGHPAWRAPVHLRRHVREWLGLNRDTSDHLILCRNCCKAREQQCRRFVALARKTEERLSLRRLTVELKQVISETLEEAT
jgi:hypothetical protein